jgi:hypothetical protein
LLRVFFMPPFQPKLAWRLKRGHKKTSRALRRSEV